MVDLTENKEIKDGVLITGCDEYIGNSLLNQFINEDKFKIFMLVDSTNKKFKESVSEGRYISKNVIPIYGDINKPLFGISDSDIHILNENNINQIWHTIDSVEYSDYYQEKIFTHNIESTKKLIELAKILKVKEFYYMSTAFVDYHIDNKKNNSNYIENFYLDSKIKAEHCLMEANKDGLFKLCIFRPSVVLDTSYNFNCIYSDLLLQLDWFFNFINDRVNNYFVQHDLVMYKKNNALLDLIPVDSMVNKVMDIAKKEGETLEIIYITNSNPIPFDNLKTELENYVHDLHIHFTEDLNDLGLIDKMLYNKISQYYYIMNDINIKNCEHDNVSRVTCDFTIEQLNTFMHTILIKNNKKKELNENEANNSLQVLTKKVLTCRYNSKLEYYSIGTGPTIILLNALGSKIDLWKWVIAHFSSEYTVIVSECRGLKDDVNYPSDQLFNSEERANDIKEIIDNENIKEVHLIGWCSGIKEALQFYEKNRDRVKSLTLIAGEYTRDVQANVQENNQIDSSNINSREMVNILIKQPVIASTFIRIISNESKITLDQSSKNDAIENIIKLINPKFNNMIQAGILNDKGLINYSKIVFVERDLEMSNYVNNVKVPTLVINGQYDTFINPNQSRWLYKKIPDAKYIELKAATHYIPVENWHELCKAIDYFIHRI